VTATLPATTVALPASGAGLAARAGLPATVALLATRAGLATAGIGAVLQDADHHRVLVAKVGLDGHDRGVKVVGRILRDAGFEVIYSGLQQTPDMVVATARDEDVDLIGLSMLSGAHMTLVPRILAGLRANGLDIPLVVGGIIPPADGAALIELGVAAILTPGASSNEIVDAVTAAIGLDAELS